MLDCFLIHLRMETARMEEGKKTEECKQEKIEMERNGYEIKKSQRSTYTSSGLPSGVASPRLTVKLNNHN